MLNSKGAIDKALSDKQTVTNGTGVSYYEVLL